MRDPQSKPTIIDEQGEYVAPEATGTPGARTQNPFHAGVGGLGGAITPIPEHLLNKKGKPSLFKMIGWKGTAVLVLVAAGIIALAAASLVVLAFAIPILLLLAVIGWVVGKVRGPSRSSSPRPGSSRSVIVVRGGFPNGR
ncbi:MAG: hypothetical protein ACK5MR_14295 [Cumulibacter sp.]